MSTPRLATRLFSSIASALFSARVHLSSPMMMAAKCRRYFEEWSIYFAGFTSHLQATASPIASPSELCFCGVKSTGCFIAELLG